MGLMNFFIKLLSIPMDKLFPVVSMFCIVGTLTVHNRLFDSWMLVLITFIGYLLVNNGYPLAPIVLGYILGPIIERNFRTGVVLYKGNAFGFMHSPISAVIMVITVLFLILPFYSKYKQSKKKAAQAAENN